MIAPATSTASAKCTSPTRRKPLFLDGSSIRLMPTSITAQPGFSHSPRTNSGRPIAATTMSARRTLSGRSFVRLWQVVTVASAFCSRAATGTPTMLLRPTTTASFPAMVMPERTSSSMQPAGVHGMNSGVRPFITSWPMFIGWKPSTSLFRLIRSSTACSFSPFGSGSCTRMPLTAGSAFERPHQTLPPPPGWPWRAADG